MCRARPRGRRCGVDAPTVLGSLSLLQYEISSRVTGLMMEAKAEDSRSRGRRRTQWEKVMEEGMTANEKVCKRM